MEASLDREARLAFLEDAEELTPLIAADADGSRYLLSTSDRHITSAFVLKAGRSDAKTLKRALLVLRSLGREVTGGTLIDVGANIGTTTISALRRHPFEHVVACEPEPQNLRLLRLNLVANRLEHDVTVENAAVGEGETELELLVYDRTTGTHEVVDPAGSTLPRADQGSSYERVPVRQVTLDELARRGLYTPADVSLLWMDVEGHEGHVLKGGSLLTELGTPVAMELWPEGIQRHGGLEWLKEIAAAHYSHFVSLRRVHGRQALQFELLPTDELDAEIDWLLDSKRHTDILLVRDPPARPAPSGRTRGQLTRDAPAGGVLAPAEPRELRRADQIDDGERLAFLTLARDVTPLVASELGGATFIVRTAQEAEEQPLFLRREHPLLRVFDSAVAVLDDLGLTESVRRGTFVDLGAGTGISTLAALLRHDFASALACEGDPGAYDVLRLNLAANDLTERTRVLPVDPAEVGPDLFVRRGLISSSDVGLVRVGAPGIVDGASELLRDAPPLLLHTPLPPTGMLEAIGYTHVAPAGETREPAALQDLRQPSGRAGWALLVRRDG
jgi:FkbM family methyltransferase